MDYWIEVHVQLNEPIVEHKGIVVVGYIKVLGVRATPDSMRSVVESCVDDGQVVWDKTEVRTVDVSRFSRRTAKPLCRPFGVGVWHKSGAFYFPAGAGTPGSELRRFRPRDP